MSDTDEFGIWARARGIKTVDSLSDDDLGNYWMTTTNTVIRLNLDFREVTRIRRLDVEARAAELPFDNVPLRLIEVKECVVGNPLHLLVELPDSPGRPAERGDGAVLTIAVTGL
jgi:hypothetical protein